MREIKFRAWHKKRKKYYPVLHLLNDRFQGLWATCIGWDCIEDQECQIQIQPKDCIIEQFTGLKDKNGKEIYEGDILSDNRGSHGTVEYWAAIGCFMVHAEEGLYNLNEKDPSRGLTLEYTEIIGNIHEDKQ